MRSVAYRFRRQNARAWRARTRRVYQMAGLTVRESKDPGERAVVMLSCRLRWEAGVDTPVDRAVIRTHGGKEGAR